MPAEVFARRATFQDFDAFVAAMSSSGGQLIPMAAGPWRARLDVAGLGGLALYRGEVPPQIRRGASAPGDVLMLARTPPGSLLHQGHGLGRGEIVLAGEGTPIDSHFRQPAVWAGVQLEPGDLARLAEGWGPRIPVAGGHAFLELGEASHDALMAAIEAGIAEATGSAELMASPAALAALRDSIEAGIQRALAGRAAWIEQPRATWQHLRIVRAANDFLAADTVKAKTIATLALELGVSRRTLHRAFAAIYGCSPLMHLKRWRLARVRAALLSPDRAPLVKTAALDHGFWHLGHFARDYRAMFGEHPSETRRALS